MASLQRAGSKPEKDFTGGTLYRGGLTEGLSVRPPSSRGELDELRRAVAAGHEGESVLRGVSTASWSSEELTTGFAECAGN